MPQTVFDRAAFDLNGWVYISPSLEVDISELLGSLGPLAPFGIKSTDYQDLIPYAAHVAPKGSMSSLVGAGPQPMHTDRAFTPDPPRYVVLKCIETGEGPCPTHVWTPEIDQLKPERSFLLTSAQWVFDDRRALSFYSCIFEWLQQAPRIRFDPCCMRPASFCRDSIELASAVLSGCSRRATVEWEKEGVLVIDNWRCLHARAAGAESAPSRRLRRWYIGD